MSIRNRAGHRELGVRSWALLLLLLGTACAAKTIPPPLPATLKYAEFVYPAVPAALATAPGAPSIERGWRFLQNDDLGGAQREFEQALKQNRTFYPARAGEGYVALAHHDYDKALAAFDAALTGDTSYAPALVGRGQSLLALKRDDDARAAFEQAVAADGSLVDVRRRIEVLQFRGVQDLIERARSAAAAGRLDEARTAYERAIATSPESSFLYRELGLLEHRQGNNDAALEHLRKAIDLDPSDGPALVEAGAILSGGVPWRRLRWRVREWPWIEHTSFQSL